MAAWTSPMKSAYPGVSIKLILNPFHSKGASARESDISRACSSGSKSVTVVPSSTDPRRWIVPARKRSASASVVLPAPECPTSATLRILSGGNTFTARASMFVIERRSDATQTCAPRVWWGNRRRLRSRTARVAKLAYAAVLNTAVPLGAWGFESLPGHDSVGRTGEAEDGVLAL